MFGSEHNTIILSLYAILPAIIIFFYVYKRDYFPEPPRIVFITLLLGAGISFPLMILIPFFEGFLETLSFGIEANYLFGTDMNDSTIFENISTSNGGIIGADGYYANINLMQRGLDSYLFTGYAIHPSRSNSSGFYILQGFGYIEKKIFIDTKNQNVPQLDENMKKGYDQFSNGFSTKTSIDYKYYHNKGRFQMSIGVNYTMTYIKNQREYDFANNKYYSSKRTWEKLLGLKTEIIIPINRKNENQFHYY